VVTILYIYIYTLTIYYYYYYNIVRMGDKNERLYLFSPFIMRVTRVSFAVVKTRAYRHPARPTNKYRSLIIVARGGQETGERYVRVKNIGYCSGERGKNVLA